MLNQSNGKNVMKIYSRISWLLNARASVATTSSVRYSLTHLIERFARVGVVLMTFFTQSYSISSGTC